MAESHLITDFFIGQEVFVTGFTGLTGKALVEKLLRTCTGIKRIFVLIRCKKEQSCEKRFEKIKNSRIFDRLHSENPTAIDKLIPIPGDFFESGLGLSEENKELMKDVTLVYHVAATVRFDESLHNAVLLNVRGTRDVCNFAKTLKNLKLLVHVSTFYCNPSESYVKEEVYPAKADWKSLLQFVETSDEVTVNALTNKFLGDFPNTYTFTKHLAERVVSDYNSEIPVVIARPSIVNSSHFEPLEGWYDSYNGLMALTTGVYTGLFRIIHGNPDAVLDLSPLDVVVKCIIVCGWWQSVKEKWDKEKTSVYNLAVSSFQGYSLATIAHATRAVFQEIAFNKCVWYPNFVIINNAYSYYIQAYIFQIIPSIFADLLLKLFRQEPILLKLQRKLFASQEALKFFTQTEFTPEAKKAVLIVSEMNKYPDFRLDQSYNMPLREHVRISFIGARKYLLNEDDSTIPSANRRLQILKYADRCIKLIFSSWIIYKICYYIAAQFV